MAEFRLVFSLSTLIGCTQYNAKIVQFKISIKFQHFAAALAPNETNSDRPISLKSCHCRKNWLIN